MGTRSTAKLHGSLMAVAAALPMLLALVGFMVDDAFVTARYATNLARGLGYVFNPGDAPTDGVTPLGYAWVLAPFARGSSPVLHAFLAAKVLGAVAWLFGVGAVGAAIAALEGSRRRYAAFALVAASAPCAAWAVAGMETGLVLGLTATASAASALGRPRTALGCASVAAAMRPELAPWAGVFALTAVGNESNDDARARLRRIACVCSAPVIVALIRLAVFGRALPLSFRAKAPNLSLGVAYAGACLLLTGMLGAVAWRGVPRWARGLALATGVHTFAMALAGGDWMPLSRLAVPALPGAFLVAAAALASERPVFSALRVVVVLAGELFAAAKIGPAAAAVGAKRLRTLEQLRPYVAGRTVATIDAGWVGVDARRVVDLAGITDPSVAALPGGHTSKRIPRGFLDARGVDTLVLLVASGKPVELTLEETHFARFTELHVAHLPGVAEAFRPIAESTDPHYVVLVRQ